MSRILTIIVFISISHSLFAQPQFQSVYWRGNANLHYSTFDNIAISGIADSYLVFDIAPGFGFSLSDKFIAGIALKFGNSIRTTGSVKNITTSYSTEAFVKYFNKISSLNKLYFSPEIKVEFGDQTRKSISPYRIMKNGEMQYMNVGLYPSFSYYFNKSFALEVIIGGLYYQSQVRKEIQERNYIIVTERGIHIDVNPTSFRFGISYLVH